MHLSLKKHRMAYMQKNQFSERTWDVMLNEYPQQTPPSIAGYHSILSPDFPDFFYKYTSLPLMKRLSGIGLLCGTDWTRLYRNRFYYSRLDHSIGVARIIWHFTHDKVQTLAGLLHDVSTPVFSHVGDFRNGDALTQESTEDANARMIKNDSQLCTLLAHDGFSPDDVCDYHRYPVADNEVPRLSADRLEYMFPSGMVLEGSWTLQEISDTYGDITLCRNEDGRPELGFHTQKAAEFYCGRFCSTGHVLQLNENKLTLQLLADIVTRAVRLGILTERDCYMLSEEQVMDKFGSFKDDAEFTRRYLTFRTMTHIEHTDHPLDDCFCVSLKVKQRYINPLVVTGNKNSGLYEARRLNSVSPYAARIISDFLSYSDTPYGCVKLA
jgi:hypothetical protein